MLHELLRGAMCCAMAATLSQTASAANGELFQFTETSSTPDGMVIARGEMVLSKAAFTAGVSISRQWISGGGDTSLDGTGIAALDFVAGDAAQSFTDPVWSDFHAYPQDIYGMGWQWSVALTSGPGGVPTGQIYFNDSANDFTFNLGDGASSGSTNTDDATSVCGWTGTCQFAGTWQDMGKAVPEPSGLLVLGPLALGLGLVRAGRR